LKQYYKTLNKFLTLANRKIQIEYLLNEIKRQRLDISIYGQQAVKNAKTNELDQIEEKAKNKLVEVHL